MEPDTVVMHLNDRSSTGFLLAKDSTGPYLVGHPLQATAPQLLGVPVVPTTRMTEEHRPRGQPQAGPPASTSGRRLGWTLPL
jgi:hypothetical protein